MVAWLFFTSSGKRARVQYQLVRLHFFNGLGLENAEHPNDSEERLRQMSVIRILRLIVSAIAFINLITALVLVLTGLWISTLSVQPGILIQILVLVVAPVLALLALYSTTLFFLLNSTYKRLLNRC